MDPSIEDRLEAAFAKQLGEESPGAAPAEEEVAPQQEPPQGESDPAESTEVEAQASPEEQPAEDDGEVVDYEGTTYKVPKEIKDALLRQSDYTRKTQEVAKQRKTYEELQQALEQERQFQQAAFSATAEAKALEAQINRFDGLDWNALANSDPAEFLKLDRAYRALKEQHAAKTQEAHQAWNHAQQEAAKRRETQAAKAHEELSRDIPGWGQELQVKLADSGKTFGFTDQELAGLIDPRMVKVLHAAHQWLALQQSKPAVAKKVQAAKPVTAPAARTAQSAHDAMRHAEAVKHLKKTGSKESAEQVLAMRFAKRYK